MSLTKTQIEDILIAWAVSNNGASLNGSKIVIADQNAPRPSRPFVTIKVTIQNDSEHADIGAPDEYGIAEIVTDRMVMASIQSFGENAVEIMDALRLSLEKGSVHEGFRRDMLPFIRVVNGFEDVADVVGTEYEDRAQMDAEFRCAGVIEDDIGVIEHVEIEGTFDDARGPDNELTVTIETGV